MRRLAVAAAACMALATWTGAASAASEKCARACLDKLVDTYIAALVAHDPSKVPLAKNVKFVENVEPHEAGRGPVENSVRGANHLQDLRSRSGCRSKSASSA